MPPSPRHTEILSLPMIPVEACLAEWPTEAAQQTEVVLILLFFFCFFLQQYALYLAPFYLGSRCLLPNREGEVGSFVGWLVTQSETLDRSADGWGSCAS